MISQPPEPTEVTRTKHLVIWFLAISSAVAVLVISVWFWLDSQRAPVITFLSTPDSSIAIDIRGAIATPGVVTLPPGSRMIDAINAAGGFRSDADKARVNLSTRLFDSDMITIPARAPAGTQEESAGRLNINTATEEELKQLPGIGDVLAGRIVLYREFNGPFQSIDELTSVEGISSKLLESLRPYITVSSP